MKERPILFSGPMVQAILRGEKTQTRRVITPQPSAYVPGLRIRLGGYNPDGYTFTVDVHAPRHDGAYFDAYCSERKTSANPRGMSDRWCWWTPDNRQGPDWIRCPYGAPGDRLWVRETWAPDPRYSGPPSEMPPHEVAWYATHDGPPGHWRPSIHMPRWASRLTLEVTDVRVERLTAITEEDARAEGVERSVSGYWLNYAPDGPTHQMARESFASLWDSINGKRPGCAWGDDPWVWVVNFRVEGGRAMTQAKLTPDATPISPPEFRDALIAIARSARAEAA